MDAALASKQLRVQCEHERVARACERHVKQPFHFLALDLFHLVFQIRAIASIKRDERLLARNNKRITNVPAEPRLAREERHNDCVPLRSLRLMRGDSWIASACAGSA